MEKSTELNPSGESIGFILGKVRLEQRRTDDALTVFERMSGVTRAMGVALVQFARGNQEESDAALNVLIARLPAELVRRVESSHRGVWRGFTCTLDNAVARESRKTG